MRAYDQAFVIAPESDQPYERDFTEWLNGATLTDAVWTPENSKITVHDGEIVGSIGRIWIQAGSEQGYCRVECAFAASDGRSDVRTWDFTIRAI